MYLFKQNIMIPNLKREDRHYMLGFCSCPTCTPLLYFRLSWKYSVVGWAKSASCIHKPSDSLMPFHHHAHSKDGAGWGLLVLIRGCGACWDWSLRKNDCNQAARSSTAVQTEGGRGSDVVRGWGRTLTPAWAQEHPTLFQQPSCAL